MAVAVGSAVAADTAVSPASPVVAVAGSSVTVSGAATSLFSTSLPVLFVDLLALRIKPKNPAPALGRGEVEPDLSAGSGSSESDLTSSDFLSFLKEKKLDFRFCSLGLVAGLVASGAADSSTATIGVASIFSAGISVAASAGFVSVSCIYFLARYQETEADKTLTFSAVLATGLFSFLSKKVERNFCLGGDEADSVVFSVVAASTGTSSGLASVAITSAGSEASALASSFFSSSTSFSFFSRMKAPKIEFLFVGLGAAVGSTDLSASSTSTVSLISVGASVEH